MKYHKIICALILLSVSATLLPMQQKVTKTDRYFTQKQKQRFLFNEIDTAYSLTAYKKNKPVRSDTENLLIYSIDQNNINIVDQLLNQPNNQPRKSTVKKIIAWRKNNIKQTNNIDALLTQYLKKQ